MTYKFLNRWNFEKIVENYSLERAQFLLPFEILLEKMFNVFRNSHKGSSETLAMFYRKPVIKKYISLLRKQLYTISGNFSEQYFYRTHADGCK